MTQGQAHPRTPCFVIVQLVPCILLMVLFSRSSHLPTVRKILVFILADSLHITFSTKAPSLKAKTYRGLTTCVLSIHKIPRGLENCIIIKEIYRTFHSQTDPYMVKSQRRGCLDFASRTVVRVHPSSWIGFLKNPLCIPWTEEFEGSLSHMGRSVGRK